MPAAAPAPAPATVQPQLPAKPASVPAAPAKQAAGKPVSRLGKVQEGRLNLPPRVAFYGPGGVGKTTLASHAEKPIFLDVEDGSAALDIKRYLFRDEENGGHVPQTYAEVLAAIDDLTLNDHPYRTLVIDTDDRLEVLLWRHILQRDSKPGRPLLNLEDYGYNKGPKIALDEWRALFSRLDRLRAIKRMSIVILGHAQVKNFKNPDGEDYDRYIQRIDEKAGGALLDWADFLGFYCFEEFGAKPTERARAKGFSTGKRLIKLARTAAYDAKARYALPAEIEVGEDDPWALFAAAVNEATSLDIPNLVGLINAEVERIGDPELKPRVDAAVAEEVKKGATDALHRFLVGLKKRPEFQGA